MYNISYYTIFSLSLSLCRSLRRYIILLNTYAHNTRVYTPEYIPTSR